MHKSIRDFYQAFEYWKSVGSPEMISVVSGKGPFSSKLSVAANFRLFYLYDPKYANFSYDIEE